MSSEPLDSPFASFPRPRRIPLASPARLRSFQRAVLLLFRLELLRQLIDARYESAFGFAATRAVLCPCRDRVPKLLALFESTQPCRQVVNQLLLRLQLRLHQRSEERRVGNACRS